MSSFWKKALEAAAWTFLQVFIVTLGAALAGVTMGDWDAIYSAAISAALAALGAALSIIKSMIVRNLGEEDEPLIFG
jgi:hypothetical protein